MQPVKAKTVLVVDDEPPVRSLMRATLQRQGFEVLEAEDGIAACELLQGRSGGIQVVVTDITMPRMDGITLGKKIHAEHPEVEILYVSAFSMDPTQDIPISRFLRKPFPLSELVQRVRRLCD